MDDDDDDEIGRWLVSIRECRRRLLGLKISKVEEK